MLKKRGLLEKFEKETGIPADNWSKRGTWRDAPMAILDPTQFGVEEGKIPVTDQMIPHLSNWYHARVSGMGKKDKDDEKIEVVGKTIYVEPINRQKPYCWVHPEQELLYLDTKKVGYGNNRREMGTHPYCPICEGDEETIKFYRTFIQKTEEPKEKPRKQNNKVRKRLLKILHPKSP